MQMYDPLRSFSALKRASASPLVAVILSNNSFRLLSYSSGTFNSSLNFLVNGSVTIAAGVGAGMGAGICAVAGEGAGALVVEAAFLNTNSTELTFKAGVEV